MQFSWDFFIIHSSLDKLPARELHELLSASSRVFLDEVGISPADNWFMTLQDAVQNTRTFVVLVSSRIGTAHYAQDEVIRAISLVQSDPVNRKIVPVLIEHTPVMPYGLGPFQYLDVRRDGGMSGVAESLIKSLKFAPGEGHRLLAATVRPKHPLEEFPATGNCPRDRISLALIGAVASALQPAMADWFVAEANAFRRSVPGEAQVPVVDINFAPPAQSVPPVVYWGSVLDEARKNSPRMIAALLLSLNTSSFTTKAMSDYNALLQFLRKLPHSNAFVKGN